MSSESMVAVHPGGLLAETLKERGISQTEFAKRLGVTQKHINEICTGRTTYSVELAIGFERVLKRPSAQFWMRLLADYQLALARGGGA